MDANDETERGFLASHLEGLEGTPPPFARVKAVAPGAAPQAGRRARRALLVLLCLLGGSWASLHLWDGTGAVGHGDTTTLSVAPAASARSERVTERESAAISTHLPSHADEYEQPILVRNEANPAPLAEASSPSMVLPTTLAVAEAGTPVGQATVGQDTSLTYREDALPSEGKAESPKDGQALKSSQSPDVALDGMEGRLPAISFSPLAPSVAYPATVTPTGPPERLRHRPLQLLIGFQGVSSLSEFRIARQQEGYRQRLAAPRNGRGLAVSLAGVLPVTGNLSLGLRMGMAYAQTQVSLMKANYDSTQPGKLVQAADGSFGLADPLNSPGATQPVATVQQYQTTLQLLADLHPIHRRYGLRLGAGLGYQSHQALYPTLQAEAYLRLFHFLGGSVDLQGGGQLLPSASRTLAPGLSLRQQGVMAGLVVGF